MTLNNTLDITVNWPKLETRRKYHTIIEVKRCLIGSVPEFCKYYFNRIDHNYSTSSTDVNIPKVKLEVGKMTFQYTGAVLYNDLPSKIKQSSTFKTFKTKVFKHLFQI